MRFTVSTLMLGLAVAACGGGEPATEEQAAQPGMAEQGQPAPAAPGETGTVHRVEMEGDGTRYWFSPEELTIATGDRVEFVNVSGWPHNVAFYENQIPAGAKAVLEAAMAGRTLGPLNGSFLTAENEVYAISFAGAPAGDYGIFCLPHEALGMKMTLTIR